MPSRSSTPNSGSSGKTFGKSSGKAVARTSSKPAARPKSGQRAGVKPGESAAAPRLLSGGNPQIAKGDGDGPVQAYLAAMPGWKAAVGRRLDALIVQTVPEVCKAVRWNTPFYGVAGQGWFLGFHCLTKYVKVVFPRGASLCPLPPVESKDPHTRYAHIQQDEPLDAALWTSWIRQAADLPGEPLF